LRSRPASCASGSIGVGAPLGVDFHGERAQPLAQRVPWAREQAADVVGLGRHQERTVAVEPEQLAELARAPSPPHAWQRVAGEQPEQLDQLGPR
jgi:hypothetical protein